MHTIIAILITAPVAYVAGFLTHWSFGSSLRAKVATELSTFGNKPSGK